jgi:hypothetical protein
MHFPQKFNFFVLSRTFSLQLIMILTVSILTGNTRVRVPTPLVTVYC